MIGNSFDYDNGPDLKGYWKNYRSGQTIYIKDTIIENGQLMGIDRNGRLVSFDALSQFVKCSKEEAETAMQSSTPVQPKAAAVKSAINEHLDDNIYTDNFSTNSFNDNLDADIFTTTNAAPMTNVPIAAKPQAKQTVDPAIVKVLDGIEDTPKITVKVQWDKFPEGLLFLQKYLSISTDDIIDAVVGRWADTNALREKVCKELERIITMNLNPKSDDTVKEEKQKTITKPTTAAKKTKKELN